MSVTVSFAHINPIVDDFKHHQSAPVLRITKRALGKDRRYPITSHYRWNLT